MQTEDTGRYLLMKKDNFYPISTHHSSSTAIRSLHSESRLPKKFPKADGLTFGDLVGVEIDNNDIIAHAETEVTHENRLQAVLEPCEKINLTLNEKKCVLKAKKSPTLVTDSHKKESNLMMKRCVPSTTCLHQLIRRK